MSSSASKSSLPSLVLAAIGVVYGDIGTSVLYAMKEVFASGHLALTVDNIYGILSLIFWTLTIIVSLKYVVLVLRADNEGEGGLIAMLALASQAVKDRPRLRGVLLSVGIFGTCLFYGDGVITPAISVLGAMEGLNVLAPGLEKYVVPLTLVILFCLFAVQKRGTGGIGRAFGPITVVWFAVIAALGVFHIADNPVVLLALNPYYAAVFSLHNPLLTFVLLGAVVLCVTGAEALYADLGHFGKKPIRLAWFAVVMPALVLNYFGQGALLLSNPGAVKNPFYMMAPEWALVPLVVLATAAAVIASQALITGAFSVTKQGDPTGLLAAPEHPAHQHPGHRADLYSRRELGLVCGHCAGGGDVQDLGQPGGCLRYCGVHRHADHHAADLLRDPLRLALPARAVPGGYWRVFCRGPAVLGLQPAEVV